METQGLREVIGGRPVCILLPGPSISQFKERVKELEGLDICYATVNDFWVMESILKTINQRLDVVMCSAKECEVPTRKHISFYKRPDKNIFITEEKSFHHSLDKCIRKYKDKLFFFTSDLEFASLACPDKERPLHFFAQASLAILISACLIGGAETIVLFGADGGDRRRQGLYMAGWNSDSEFRIGYDTGVFNMTMPNVLRNVCQTHDITRFRIINCSPDTYYATFPVASYDTTMRFLNEILRG